MKLSLRGQERLRLAIIYVLCAVVLIWALAPIYWVAVSSISTRQELYARPYKIWFPRQPTLESYQTIFTQGAKFRSGGFSPTAHLMGTGLRNSVIISVASAGIVTLMATGAGYAFARMNFRGKKCHLPADHADDSAADLGLFDRLVFPDVAAWPGRYAGRPDSDLRDPAPAAFDLADDHLRARYPERDTRRRRVDGADRWRLVYSIVLPLARPGMVAVFLVGMLTTWNNFLIPLIFSRTDDSSHLPSC